MRIPLSARLVQCKAFVKNGSVTADVGCDHGYLGITLLSEGISARVLACDINREPLAVAQKNAQKFGVADKMNFYLTDGLKNVPGEYDTAVLAGMGADVMESILGSAPDLKERNVHLILQCQSRTPYLRKYLSEQGWEIRREAVLRDGRFLYTVMDVYPGTQILKPADCWFPPALLAEGSPALPEYFRWAVKQLRVKAQADPALSEIADGLEEKYPQFLGNA